MSRINSLVTVVFMLLFFGNAVGQQQNMLPLVQSPNAAGLGTFGNVEVSPFTGLANVSVPVFSLKQGDIPVNCMLSYNTGGVKASAHPGWVGLNWTLNVGGVITRKVNGGVDEVCNPQVATTDPNFLAYSLLAHPGVLNDPNWSSTTFINNYWSGANNDIYNSNIIVNPAPDEFMFTLPTGVSGSFFLNYDGTWQVKSKSTTKLVVTDVQVGQMTLSYDDAFHAKLNIQRAIKQITIADAEGFVYTFGTTGSDDRSIEFTRMPRVVFGTHWQEYNIDVIATAWNLTKITSPSGNVVNFSYSRPANQYVQGVLYPNYTSVSFTGQMYMGGWYGYSESQATYTGQVISPSYLSSITCNAFTASFNITPTAEATYTYVLGSIWMLPKWNYGDLDINDYNNPTSPQINGFSKWYQLNSISVADNAGVQRQNYLFFYGNTSSQRLSLSHFAKDNLDNAGDMNYYFTYNTTPLPAYNAMQQDQWGYYNGQQFPSSVTTTYPLSTSLLNYLSMDATKAQAGILNTIKYPTGGTTTFTYQANDYSNVLQKNGTAINLVPQAGNAGGLRVYTITDNDDNGHSYTKTYSYVKQSTGASSGILSGYNKIIFSTQIGAGSGAHLSTMLYDDYMTRPNATDGRDVVYSEVKETLPDGSSNIYTYSNSDNPAYMDEPPVNVVTNAFEYSDFNGLYAGTYLNTLTSTGSNPFMSHTSRELERGMLLTVTSKNAAGLPVKFVQNTYNSDASRFNNYIRTFDNYANTGAIGSYIAVEQYFQPIKIYTYYPHLTSTATTTYDQNGVNPVTMTQSYTYNDTYRNQITESFASSENEAVVTTTSYAPDAISNLPASASTAKSAMVTANMTGVPLEKIVTRNAIQTEHTRMDYQVSGSAILPATYNEAFSTNALEARHLYSKYDNYGNLVEHQKPYDLPTAYIYDYKNNYVIAEVTNANQSNVAYTSFEADGKGNWSFAGGTTTDNTSPTGNNCYNLGGGAVSASGLNSNTTYTVTYWIKGSSALSIPGTIGGYPIHTATSKDGLWSCFTHKVTGQTTVTVGGTGFIDELRLFPVGSLMKTNTYLPLIGLSSQCDANNHITYYQYDGLGRLHLVLDQDKYVTKRVDYAFYQKLYYNRGLLTYLARTGCGTGYQGSIVGYFVPPGIYSSIVDQATVNAQEQADANANAQNYANANGVCNPGVTGYNTLPVSFTITFTSTGGAHVYTYFVGATSTPSSIIGYIPPGTYNIQVCPNGTYSSQYAFEFVSTIVKGTGCLSVSNQTVSIYGDAAIYLTPPGQSP